MINFLVTYLNYNPELKGPLPEFRLPGKAVVWTEAQLIFPKPNKPHTSDVCDLTVESLRSLIDVESTDVSWMVMENYYTLLQKTFQSNDSRVTICNYHSTQCIYQVSEMFQKLPTKDQVFTKSTCSQMMREPDLAKIQASESTSKIMLFPFYYLPDKQFLLGIVLRDSG